MTKLIIVLSSLFLMMSGCTTNDSTKIEDPNAKNDNIQQTTEDTKGLPLDGINDSKADTSVIDSDGDSVADLKDNCPFTQNKNQEDADFDAMGDKCDPNPILADYTNYPDYKPEDDLYVPNEAAEEEDIDLEIIRACTHHARFGLAEGAHANLCDEGSIKLTFFSHNIALTDGTVDINKNELISAISVKHDSLTKGYLHFTLKGFHVSTLRAVKDLDLYGLQADITAKMTCTVGGQPTFLTQSESGTSITATHITTGVIPLKIYGISSTSYYMNAINDNTCDTGYSPLVLDLEGDGFELTDNGAVNFDINSDNNLEKHAWIENKKSKEQDNVLLALDLNNDLIINSGAELFGNYTKVGEANAANGFLALEQYDANKDKKITKADPSFTQLRLWVDKNMDGRSQMDELFTLDDKKITQIDLNYTSNEQTDSFGNSLKFKSSFTIKDDAKAHDIVDVFFMGAAN